MSFEDEWVANEDGLVREAGSLGELLARTKGLFSPLPIDGGGWEGLVERARELPPTLAGFPLWLGFPIDDSRPAVSLNVSLPGGTRSAAFFEDKGRSGDADPSAAGIASLLGETGKEDSPLRRVVGDRVLLQYDIDPARRTQREPGIFLYPVRPTLAGDPSGRRLRDFRVALDAMTSAAGWEPDEPGRRHIERAYLALEPDTRIGAIGAFPSRRRTLRLTMLGFDKACDVMTFLERVDWPGRLPAVASALARIEERGAFARMQLGIQLDIGAAGVGPTLELQVFSANTIYDHTGWFKDKGHWTDLIDGLREERLAIPEKLPGLAEWSSGAKMLFGRSGPLLFFKRIHHFAIVLTADGVERVDAYVFLLMSRLPRRGDRPR